MINSLLLSPKYATSDENLVIKAFICSFSIFGGLIFPIVNVFAKLPQFSFIINPSQCSYELRLIITSALYV